jgi:hypothetical protein
MRRLAIIAAGAICAGALALPAIGTAGDGGKAFAPKDCTKPRIEPKRIVITCGDGGFYIKMKHWASFNGKEATGKGKAFINSCDPSCAAGTFNTYAVKVHLTKPKKSKCNGRKVPLFSKIEVMFKDPPPKGLKTDDTYPLFCD